MGVPCGVWRCVPGLREVGDCEGSEQSHLSRLSGCSAAVPSWIHKFGGAEFLQKEWP